MYGERAAEQHEKDQPSEPGSCLRPDGAKPELEPLADREDFETRMRRALGKLRLFADLKADSTSSKAAHHGTYADQQTARTRTEMDQLVLMRAAQILDEAAVRRQSVMAKFAAGAVRNATEGSV